MNLNDLIVPARVLINAKADSRKAALEILGELLAKSDSTFTRADALQSMIARERLGSTAVGGGVAVPHGRIKGLGAPIGALIRLTEPIDYQADDGARVDLLCAVLVPETCEPGHTALLSTLMRRCADPALADRMRVSRTSQDLYEALTAEDWHGNRRMGAGA